MFVLDIEKLRQVTPKATHAEAKRYLTMATNELEETRKACDELHAALKGLVDECHEAIKTEEWDGDNAAYQAAVRVAYPERYADE